MSQYSIEYLQNNVMVDITRHGKPWHGYDLPDDFENFFQGPIPIEAVQNKLFPWEPIGLDLKMVVPDGTNLSDDVAARLVDEGFIIPDFKVWVRDDTYEIMGIHSDGYVGHSYKKWLLEQVSAILDDELTIASAGLLNDGAQAWVEVSIPDAIKGPGDVEFRPLLLATTSLDGTIATTYKRTIILVVCDNTRAAALNGTGGQFKVKHTKNSELRLLEARDALEIVHGMTEDFSKELDTLLTQKVTPKQFSKFLEVINPVPVEDYARREGSNELIVLNKKQITMAERRRDALTYTYNHDERVAPWKGTAFGVMQAVNTHDHHESRVNKGTVRLERNMHRAATGYYDKLDRDTYNTLQTVLA